MPVRPWLGPARSNQENVSFFVFFLHLLLLLAFPTVIWPKILLTPLGTAAAESLPQCITTSTTLFAEAPPSSQPPLSTSVTSPSGVPLQTRHDCRPHAYRRTGKAQVQPPPATPQNTLSAAAARFPRYRLAGVCAANEPTAVSHGVSVEEGQPGENPHKKRAETARRKRVTADTTGVTHLMGSPSGLVSAACSRHIELDG